MKSIHYLTYLEDYWQRTLVAHKKRDPLLNATYENLALLWKRVSDSLKVLSGTYINDICRLAPISAIFVLYQRHAETSILKNEKISRSNLLVCCFKIRNRYAVIFTKDNINDLSDYIHWKSIETSKQVTQSYFECATLVPTYALPFLPCRNKQRKVWPNKQQPGKRLIVHLKNV